MDSYGFTHQHRKRRKIIDNNYEDISSDESQEEVGENLMGEEESDQSDAKDYGDKEELDVIWVFVTLHVLWEIGGQFNAN